MTRGLGDHDLKVHDSNIFIKPFLSCCPEVRVLVRCFCNISTKNKKKLQLYFQKVFPYKLYISVYMRRSVGPVVSVLLENSGSPVSQSGSGSKALSSPDTVCLMDSFQFSLPELSA